MGIPQEAILNASYRNPQRPQGTVVSVSGSTVVVQAGNRTLTYNGVDDRPCVGEEVDLPLKARSWSCRTKWSPFDVPTEDDD